MPGFGIFGKVSVDGSALKQIAAETKAAFGPVGSAIGQQFRGQLMNYIGGAAIAAAIKKSIDNATEIRAGANKAETNTDRFQAMKRVADEAGTSVDALVEILKAGGTPADELSDSLNKVEKYMKETSQIIDEGSVSKMAELGDKLKDLMGKLYPFFAFILDWGNKLFDMGAKGADLATGKFISTVGKIGKFLGMKGSDSMIQAGNEQFNEAMATKWWDKSKAPQSPIPKVAFDIASIQSDAEAKKRLKDMVAKDQAKLDEMKKNPAHLPVGGLSQSGAIFGDVVRMNQMNQDQQLRYLEAIARHTAEF